MTAPISLDIRKRLVRLVEGGLSARSASRHLMISPATGVRIAAKHRAGESLVPAAAKAHYRGKLIQYKAFFEELIEQDADMTLAELCSALEEAHGLRASASGLCRALKRFGFTYKKRRWLLPSALSQG